MAPYPVHLISISGGNKEVTDEADRIFDLLLETALKRSTTIVRFVRVRNLPIATSSVFQCVSSYLKRQWHRVRLKQYNEQMAALHSSPKAASSISATIRLIDMVRKGFGERMLDNRDKVLGLFSNDIGIDLGTANTLVYVKGRGIVINKPSIVAMNQKTGAFVAVGAAAKEMMGRTPAHIIAVQPVVDGVISDFEVTAEMLSYLVAIIEFGPPDWICAI